MSDGPYVHDATARSVGPLDDHSARGRIPSARNEIARRRRERICVPPTEILNGRGPPPSAKRRAVESADDDFVSTHIGQARAIRGPLRAGRMTLPYEPPGALFARRESFGQR